MWDTCLSLTVPAALGNKTTGSIELLGNNASHRKSLAVGVVQRGNCSTLTAWKVKSRKQSNICMYWIRVIKYNIMSGHWWLRILLLLYYTFKICTSSSKSPQLIVRIALKKFWRCRDAFIINIFSNKPRNLTTNYFLIYFLSRPADRARCFLRWDHFLFCDDGCLSLALYRRGRHKCCWPGTRQPQVFRSRTWDIGEILIFQGKHNYKYI